MNTLLSKLKSILVIIILQALTFSLKVLQLNSLLFIEIKLFSEFVPISILLFVSEAYL